MIKFPPLPMGKKIRYLRKDHIFSSFPNFAFSFISREFEKSYQKYLNVLKKKDEVNNGLGPWSQEGKLQNFKKVGKNCVKYYFVFLFV